MEAVRVSPRTRRSDPGQARRAAARREAAPPLSRTDAKRRTLIETAPPPALGSIEASASEPRLGGRSLARSLARSLRVGASACA